MPLRVAQVQRVHDHADVRGVLARLPHMWNLDQLESRLVQPALELLVAVEIAVSLLHHDVALEEQAFEHLADVEGGKAGVARAEGDVLEIEEDRHRGVRIGGAHGVRW